MQVSETTAAAKIDEGISRGFARINADLKKAKMLSLLDRASAGHEPAFLGRNGFDFFRSAFFRVIRG